MPNGDGQPEPFATASEGVSKFQVTIPQTLLFFQSVADFLGVQKNHGAQTDLIKRANKKIADNRELTAEEWTAWTKFLLLFLVAGGTPHTMRSGDNMLCVQTTRVKRTTM